MEAVGGVTGSDHFEAEEVDMNAKGSECLGKHASEEQDKDLKEGEEMVASEELGGKRSWLAGVTCGRSTQSIASAAQRQMP